MQRNPEDIWAACLEIIRDNVSRQSYKTWFEPLKAVALDEEDSGAAKLTVRLPSRFYHEWLEEHYLALIRKTVSRVLGPQGRLVYDIEIERGASDERARMQLPVRPSDAPPPAMPPPLGPSAGPSSRSPVQSRSRSFETPSMPFLSPPSGASIPSGAPSPVPVVQNPFVVPGIQKPQIDSQLNPNYTFDRFIEGDCNRLARSASWAIAQQPGATSFNPFLIYGGVGLGKTHLIQAIGNYARVQQNVDTVLYVSSERFTNEFVQSIQHNRVSEFSMFYRQMDLLIVDDVQFFGGKEKTQEEFFHIFNALHQDGKQIVLSSDRPPKEIPGIEERLLSRFHWGLTADVQMPELETRIAILLRKAEDDGIALPDEVIEFIAHNVKSNIRELEGSLIRLLAFSTLRRAEIDLRLAREVLRDFIGETSVNMTIDEIQRIVCEYFDIAQDLVKAKTRKREIVQARQVAMYFCKQFTKHSLKTIGLHFGGRDHSTVIHANQTVENQIETDPKFQQIVEDIRHRISLRSR